jgi:ubiquinone/menaquinone biosynthesis C-methylase UbiE
MDIMHPLRHKMIEISLDVLPSDQGQSPTAVDLGVGTGVFTLRFLERFPRARVIAIDGAESMIELASARLGSKRSAVEFVVGDFRDVARLLQGHDRADVVFSAYALHHLSAEEKVGVVRESVKHLKPSGWFMNADLVVAADPDVERRVQQIRVDGIVRRAGGRDERFRDVKATRAFLDDLEATEGDRPLTLSEDVRIAREAGLNRVEVFWREYREVVYGGPK